MQFWFIASTVLHILVMAAMWLGLPQMHKPIPKPPVIIPIEIAELAPITATKIEEKKEPPPQPVKPEPPKPEEPRPPEPKPEPPKPEPPKPPEAKPEPALPVPEPKPPEPKPEPIPTPKPKPKPPEPKPEPPKKDALSSVLKNVAKLKNEPKPETEPKKVEQKQPDQKEPTPAPTPPQAAATAERLSISDEDALRRQIAGCWNVPVGARDIENMAVEIYISVNPDRTVKEAIVVDQARLGRDSFFRALAESALRALRNPRCSPLILPEGKYAQWKEIVFNFNPKDMF